MEKASVTKTGSRDSELLAVDPLKTAWENVVLKGLPPGREIREEVLRSWIRCKEIGIDPFSENPPPALSNSKLRALIRRNRDLIEVSKPVIEMIQLSVKGTGFIITLTERQGHVLVVSGDSDVLEMAERNFYQPGCLRTIEVAGTNAIGLCLIEGRPIQLTGAQHYKARHHPWTCSSAPIYDVNNQLIGVITLSGRSTGQHRHTLALVTEAADAIGGQLRERALIEEKNKLNSMLTSIFNSISDGVIAFNNNLCITHMNRAASQMLGLEGAILGSRLDKVVRPEPKLLEAIKKRNYLNGVEISFHCPGGQKAYICRLDPIRNSSLHEIGAILTLAEKRHMINIAKRIGGNYAKYEFRDIKGKSRLLLKQIKLAKIAAKTNSRVLIIGESGTGKELFAQAIHCYSARRNEPFVAISCATIPRDLIESELFGYKEGAFTGARRGGMVGKFELANRGTLFLDEIDGLPLELQSKLLRVLQQNEIMRLGDTQTIPIDVRVIAASNKDLLTEVEKANFREDLYYRLNVVEIHIPPLRDRIEDLELLMDHILERQCQLMNIRKPRISGEVLDILKSYSWPGNVRELENCVERALLLCQGNTIRKAHLPARLFKKPQADLSETISLQKGLQEMILSTLERCDWNISQAARELKISRSTLYRKIKGYKSLTRRR
ncbi:MAG: sigma-54-dependent Fis family transcriptional regulator [Deltaproteobacteria bacterium]|nr:sigma-54-dependent Fis family transcriptional regulator [Deltaproteobacteria bacterium]